MSTMNETKKVLGKLLPSLVLLFLMLQSLTGEGKTRKIYDITRFGALADSTVVNTEAIQSAIDQCADAGGGTVVLPAGTYLSGALFFK